MDTLTVRGAGHNRWHWLLESSCWFCTKPAHEWVPGHTRDIDRWSDDLPCPYTFHQRIEMERLVYDLGQWESADGTKSNRGRCVRSSLYSLWFQTWKILAVYFSIWTSVHRFMHLCNETTLLSELVYKPTTSATCCRPYMSLYLRLTPIILTPTLP